jgi:hypothetical protein
MEVRVGYLDRHGFYVASAPNGDEIAQYLGPDHDWHHSCASSWYPDVQAVINVLACEPDITNIVLTEHVPPPAAAAFEERRAKLFQYPSDPFLEYGED